MAMHWVVDPQTGRGAPMNDAAAREAAAEGWIVTAYDQQDGGLGGYGIDPNANMPHQITADKVLVYNANTNRYEWMSSALVAAQQAATGQYNAQTQRAATTADIIAASRGPENAFQYSNATHGMPDASGVGIFDALAGRIGGATTAGTPDQGDLEPINILDRINAIVNRSFGTGGENGSGQSAWADAAGMAPTQKEQQAAGAMQAAQQPPAGQEGAAATSGTSISAPYDPPTSMRHGPNTSDTPGTYISAPYDPGTPPTAVRHGPNTSKTPGTYISAPYDPPPKRGGLADVAGGVNALGLPMNELGKLDTSQYEQASGLSGSGKSDIAWKNKLTNLVGKGSEARSAAYAKAGMSGADFNRLVKHGKDPFKRSVHAAEGMLDVITGPTTIHAGEDGKDEIHIVIPMERADQPVPRALLALANQMSPDLDQQRGVGGVTDAGSDMALHDYTGPPIPDTRYVLPALGGAGGSAHGGWTGQMPPEYGVAPLDPTQTVPMGPPTPPGLQRGGSPMLDMERAPDGSYHAAQGGGLAVLGGSTSVKQANSPVNALGQVTVPYGRGTRQYPASRTTPMPNFGQLPPALLSLITPSDWKLIGSQYGAAGGNAADIPFLLGRGVKGLGRAPAAYGGKVF
jgi:hypothetical protein